MTAAKAIIAPTEREISKGPRLPLTLSVSESRAAATWAIAASRLASARPERIEQPARPPIAVSWRLSRKRRFDQLDWYFDSVSSKGERAGIGAETTVRQRASLRRPAWIQRCRERRATELASPPAVSARTSTATLTWAPS